MLYLFFWCKANVFFIIQSWGHTFCRNIPWAWDIVNESIEWPFNGTDWCYGYTNRERLPRCCDSYPYHPLLICAHFLILIFINCLSSYHRCLPKLGMGNFLGNVGNFGCNWSDNLSHISNNIIRSSEQFARMPGSLKMFLRLSALRYKKCCHSRNPKQIRAIITTLRILWQKMADPYNSLCQ